MSGTVSFPSNKVFIGFSTVGAELKRNTVLYDIDLIKRDLTNAFYTRIGERIMRPNFGCAIWDYFMEPLTDFLRDQISKEAIRVCELDSRLAVQNVTIFELDAGVRVEITLLYIPFAVYDTFQATFEQRQVAYIAGQVS